MGFSEQLKKARLNIGYTQQQVADLMGITKSTYCGYETGKRRPDVAKIKQLANILNTSGDTLLETGFGKETLFKNQKKQKEFFTIFNELSPAFQDYLIKTAKNLLDTQSKMQSNNDNEN